MRLLLMTGLVAAVQLSVSGVSLGQVEVDSVELHFMPTPPIGTTIPRDGVCTRGAIAIVRWRGTPPPGATLTIAFGVVPGFPGTMTPATVPCPLTQNPVSAGSVYSQTEGAKPVSTTITAQATAGDKSAIDNLPLAGCSLETRKASDDELYSGTATGHACCDVKVFAFCPEDARLKPQGKVCAQVGDAQDGVYLKWIDSTPTPNTPHWAKERERPLTSQWDPVTQSYRSTCGFCVATDNPADLPDRAIDAAFVTYGLNSSTSDVLTTTTSAVLVPQLLDIVEETGAIKKDRNFYGDLAWYADEAKAKFYWGAKGAVTWSAPQDAHCDYHQATFGNPHAEHFSGPQETVETNVTTHITEEHNKDTGGYEAWVNPRPHDKLAQILANWGIVLTGVDHKGDLEDACLYLAWDLLTN